MAVTMVGGQLRLRGRSFRSDVARKGRARPTRGSVGKDVLGAAEPRVSEEERDDADQDRPTVHCRHYAVWPVLDCTVALIGPSSSRAEARMFWTDTTSNAATENNLDDLGIMGGTR